MAIKYNLSIDQGTTYSQSIQVLDGLGTPLDLTGYNVASQLREAYTDATASAAFTCSIDSPPTSGSFTLSLHPSSSMALTGSCYVYDVELHYLGAVSRVLEGKATLSPNVTR